METQRKGNATKTRRRSKERNVSERRRKRKKRKRRGNRRKRNLMRTRRAIRCALFLLMCCGEGISALGLSKNISRCSTVNAHREGNFLYHMFKLHRTRSLDVFAKDVKGPLRFTPQPLIQCFLLRPVTYCCSMHSGTLVMLMPAYMQSPETWKGGYNLHYVLSSLWTSRCSVMICLKHLHMRGVVTFTPFSSMNVCFTHRHPFLL